MYSSSHSDRLSDDFVLLLNQRVFFQQLVAKPDQLIKRRGKLGLLETNVNLDGIRDWLSKTMGKQVKVGKAKGSLENFIVEPFVPHKQVRWQQFHTTI